MARATRRVFGDDGRRVFKHFVGEATDLSELSFVVANELRSGMKVEVYLRDRRVSEHAGYVENFVLAQLDEFIKQRKFKAKYLHNLSFIV